MSVLAFIRQARLKKYLRLINVAYEATRPAFVAQFNQPDTSWDEFAERVLSYANQMNPGLGDDADWFFAQRIFLKCGPGGLPTDLERIL